MTRTVDLSALTCVCGISVALHRIGGAQVSCAEARDRFFMFGDTVSESEQQFDTIAPAVHDGDGAAQLGARLANRRVERVRV